VNIKFIQFLKDPFTKENLQFFSFENNAENIISGILLNKISGNVFPIIKGVPVLLSSSLTKDFCKKYEKKLIEIKKNFPSASINPSTQKNTWSFSLEWDSHNSKNLDTTWGMSTSGRYEQFLIENQIKESQLNNKIVLDAGCGNGMLSEYISQKDCLVFGIDYSESVFMAEEKRKSENVCFVRGDLQHPPFDNDFFDIIFSNGVLHHTPDTYKTFKSVAKCVKPEGRFYLWLYCRKGGFLWRIKRRWFDFLRTIVSRTHSVIQKCAVNIHTSISFGIQYLSGKKFKRNFDEIRIDMYDSITPRWRYYHDPLEVSKWFFECGFNAGILTHWDNPYGFGMLGYKNKITRTPGVNYTNKYLNPHN